MVKIDKGKEAYDNIKVPEELNEIVLNAIKKSEDIRREKNIISMKKKKLYYKWGTGIVASLILAIIIGVNSNATFAMEMQKIPVIGRLIEVFTIRSYEQNEDDLKISIEIPEIKFIKEDTMNLSDEVNIEISNMCNAYANEAKERAKEYKKAFIDTGGTEEEWIEHKIKIKVWYEIKSQTNEYLSFAVFGTESWSSAYSEAKYYNLDLKNLNYLTLEDILGKNYIQIVNDNIKLQIHNREKEENIYFWSVEQGGFTSIDENTKFYINNIGNPVIVFEKYEIAPGAMGKVEFEIER